MNLRDLSYEETWFSFELFILFFWLTVIDIIATLLHFTLFSYENIWTSSVGNTNSAL